jgi:hypothetical protein
LRLKDKSNLKTARGHTQRFFEKLDFLVSAAEFNDEVAPLFCWESHELALTRFRSPSFPEPTTEVFANQRLNDLPYEFDLLLVGTSQYATRENFQRIAAHQSRDVQDKASGCGVVFPGS